MQTIIFNNKPRILATGTIAGPKECAGIVGKFVDKALADDMFGESAYEKAECKMLSYAISTAMENANLKEQDVDLLISGDPTFTECWCCINIFSCQEFLRA